MVRLLLRILARLVSSTCLGALFLALEPAWPDQFQIRLVDYLVIAGFMVAMVGVRILLALTCFSINLGECSLVYQRELEKENKGRYCSHHKHNGGLNMDTGCHSVVVVYCRVVRRSALLL